MRTAGIAPRQAVALLADVFDARDLADGVEASMSAKAPMPGAETVPGIISENSHLAVERKRIRKPRASRIT